MESFIIATRGSALALAQSNYIRQRCQAAAPGREVELKIIKTTGDKLQGERPPDSPEGLPKGLFTKELEVALLANEADFAVHSLKDLPTDLPPGLELLAVPEREDPSDVLIYRADSPTLLSVSELPGGAIIATSSTRRQAQLLALKSDLKMIPIRGNVGTRLNKLHRGTDFYALVLAVAGLKRLGLKIENGILSGPAVPTGCRALILCPDEMLPCVGQAALGIEGRQNDSRIGRIVETLNHPDTHACVRAERAFLRGMGGGCLSPVAALAEIHDDKLFIRAVSFRDGSVKRGQLTGPPSAAETLGLELSKELA